MSIAQFLPLIIIVLAAYFLFLRPQKARQRKAAELASAIAPGQRVMTTAGMFATVTAVDDEGVTLEISDGVHAKFVRQAISRVVEPEFVSSDNELEDDSELEDDEYDDTEYEDSDSDETTDQDDNPHTGATAVGAYAAVPEAAVDLRKDAQPGRETTDQTASSSASH